MLMKCTSGFVTFIIITSLFPTVDFWLVCERCKYAGIVIEFQASPEAVFLTKPDRDRKEISHKV